MCKRNESLVYAYFSDVAHITDRMSMDLFIFLFFIGMMTSCKNSNYNLEGDWISRDKEYTLSLRNGKGMYLSPLLFFTTYTYSNDTICFDEFEYFRTMNRMEIAPSVKFPIISCKEDTLVLEVIKNYLSQPENMTFNRVVGVNQDKIVGFAFHAFHRVNRYKEMYLEYREDKDSIVIGYKENLHPSVSKGQIESESLTFQNEPINKSVTLIRDEILSYLQRTQIRTYSRFKDDHYWYSFLVDYGDALYVAEVFDIHDAPMELNIIAQYMLQVFSKLDRTNNFSYAGRLTYRDFLDSTGYPLREFKVDGFE